MAEIAPANALVAKMSSTQLKFHNSPARYRAMICGLGAGKTFSLCLEAVMISQNYPGTRGMIVASTYRNLSDFVIPMLTRELWEAMGDPELNAWKEMLEGFNKQDNIIRFKNGSSIYLRSCDRPDDLRGPNLGWFGIDEAGKIRSKHVWRIMVGRLRRPPEKGFLTTTPRGRDWIWEEFARREREGYNWFTGATDENKNLSPEYIDSLLDSYTGAFLRQEFYGEFVGWQGLVYPQVALERHHLAAPESTGLYKYAIAGVDWGWTDPSTIVVGLVQSDDKIHLVDEFYKKKAPIEEIVEKAVELRHKWGIRTFYCDSARPEYIAEFKKAKLDARKGYKEIDPGIALVNRLLDKELLTMNFNAVPNTINEFEVYHYEESDTGEIKRDRPLDKDNHCMDALRYLAYSQSKRGHASSRSTR